jgi:hypothetical protein
MILVGVTKGLTKLTFELKTKTGLPKPKSLVFYEGENSEATARVELKCQNNQIII